MTRLRAFRSAPVSSAVALVVPILMEARLLFKCQVWEGSPRIAQSSEEKNLNLFALEFTVSLTKRNHCLSKAVQPLSWKKETHKVS